MSTVAFEPRPSTRSESVDIPAFQFHNRSRPPIPRSASSTTLPSAVPYPAQATKQSGNGIKRNLSELVVTSLEKGVQHGTSPKASLSRSGAESLPVGSLGSLGSDAKIAISRIAVTERQGVTNPARRPTTSGGRRASDVEPKTRAISGPLRSFSRRSWYVPSPSPSPVPRDSKRDKVSESNSITTQNGILPNGIRPGSSSSDDSEIPAVPQIAKVHQRHSSTASRKRPLSALLGRPSTPFFDASAQVPSLPKSASTDRLPLTPYDQLHRARTAGSSISIPSSPITLKSLALDVPRKKDELWSSFRSLDAEFQKFQSKPGTQKSNVIRSTLLPFLRTYADHPSNKALKAEDLDRRIHILNKWWVALLEMLNGRNGHSVSGADRQSVLEAATAMMNRPEWKLPLSSILARPERSRPTLKSRSTSSLNSNASDFLAESVIHNVRNVFIQNLMSQMAFVVDKMSMRSAPASLVAFCGKATATAFLYCPGVAEILVRLWAISSETILRVLKGANIDRTTNLSSIAEQVSGSFPIHLRSLSFKSLASLMRHLRRKPQLPLSSSYIPWQGPWVGRWAGRDSDLFFVFMKHFHMLSNECLTEDATDIERACAPCTVLVHSQLLTIIDATIHRNANAAPVEPTEGPSSITFDDLLGPDASAAVLPVPPPSTIRSMAENRLIVLLREFLAENSAVSIHDRKTFAELFGTMLRLVAIHTSLFDHNSCFTLCDFLEESLLILARFYKDVCDPFSFLDWNFWKDVYTRMTCSNNSMTTVRVFSFVFSMWGNLVWGDDRKRDLCLNWVLEKQFFDENFNHWCPMVRAYYMRLLCWRVARLDPETSDLNLQILTTLRERLASAWCYFLYIQQEGDKGTVLRQSTSPCNAAPGRRLVIVRNDVHQSAAAAYINFDGVLAASSNTQPTAYERRNVLKPQPLPLQQKNVQARSPSPGKNRWGALKSMIFFTNSPKKGTDTRDAENNTPNEKVNEPSIKDAAPKQPIGPGSKNTAPVIPHHQSHSFKFSLEWADKSIAKPRDLKLQPPRLPPQVHSILQYQRPENRDFQPVKPMGSAIGPSKYTGRALAEWAAIIAECSNFFERRKHEGVPGYKLVETPTLGVESFRKPG